MTDSSNLLLSKQMINSFISIFPLTKILLFTKNGPLLIYQKNTSNFLDVFSIFYLAILVAKSGS